MTVKKICQAISGVREKYPLIHSITNPISINQCANAVLCTGARPVMAEHPDEVREITATADALLLNIGNITDVRMKSILLSAACADDKNIPVVLDLVGIACSVLRRTFVQDILLHSPAVIKGNYSEIYALFSRDYRTSGVDNDGLIDIADVTRKAAELAQRYNCAVLASGKIDIVTDGRKILYIKNGSPQLARITGTGCMLGVLTACYASVSDGFTAAATACAVLGICGEKAQTDNGSGSFLVNLLDALSTLTGADIEKHLKTEETEIEKL